MHFDQALFFLDNFCSIMAYLWEETHHDSVELHFFVCFPCEKWTGVKNFTHRQSSWSISSATIKHSLSHPLKSWAKARIPKPWIVMTMNPKYILSRVNFYPLYLVKNQGSFFIPPSISFCIPNYTSFRISSAFKSEAVRQVFGQVEGNWLYIRPTNILQKEVVSVTSLIYLLKRS